MNALGSRGKKRIVGLTLGGLGLAVTYLAVLRWIDRPIVFADSIRGGVLLAAVPIFLLLLGMVVAMRCMKGMDELERKIHTEAMAIGFLLSLLILSTAGFLALGGVVALSLSWIAPVMVLSWIAGLLLLSVRYR